MSTLYEADFYGWAIEQAAALRRAAEVRLNAPVSIDWQNVAEEIESMGKEQAAKLRSSFRVLLLHLLKWRFQSERRSSSWRRTIIRERINVEQHLTDNPGLKPRREELLLSAYRLARKEAAMETGLPMKDLPEACPFSLDEVCADDFYPQASQRDRLR
jgi:hypothetical protein